MLPPHLWINHHYVMEMRPSRRRSQLQLPMPIFQVATVFVFVGTAALPSAICNDARFLPESHILKQYTHSACWGHEIDCPKTATPAAHVDCSDATNTPFHLVGGKSASEAFFSQADFGYVGEFVSSLHNYCRPETQFDSSLTCTANLQFCSGRNIFIDFDHIMNRGKGRNLKYSMEVLARGKIGGKCKLKKELLEGNIELMAPLQSWAPELRYFEPTVTPTDAVDSEKCDLFVNLPTIVMKLDATVSMYHHLCDFFNLYISLHLNSTFYRDSFERNVNILVFDNIPYKSTFGDMFKAFTKHEILNLNSFGRKTVCFKNLLLPLLPRMPFGLFYNTPVITGCKNSALFKAFSEFITYRLGVTRKNKPDANRLRVTFLSRRTKYRRTLNENSLIASLESTGKYDVTFAQFSHSGPAFVDQIQTIHETDILIGMHGSGLTHLLFLPDWACLFELYDCGDPSCYSDLARFRGVHRISWTNSSLLSRFEDNLNNPHRGHEKFMNYAFDESEFVRKVDEAANMVKNHRVFREATIDNNHEETEGADEKCALPGDRDIDDDNNEIATFKLSDEL